MSPHASPCHNSVWPGLVSGRVRMAVDWCWWAAAPATLPTAAHVLLPR